MGKHIVCPGCKTRSKLTFKFLRFGWPPQTVKCDQCGLSVPTNFEMRCAYTNGMIFEVIFLATYLITALSLVGDKMLLVLWLAFGWLFAIVSATLFALVLQIPVQLVLDILGGSRNDGRSRR